MEYVTDNSEEKAAVPHNAGMPARRSIATPLLLVFFLVLYGIMFYQARGWNMSLRELALEPFGRGLLSRFGALIGTGSLESCQLWRFVTAAFVHLNMVHLAINSYCIFNLGRMVESCYGTRRMFVSFVACSAAANAFTVALAPSPAVHIGTLGGLFGLDGMVLGFALRNRTSLPAKSFHWMLGSALFWPVLWVLLSFTFPAFRGGVWGLVAGFGAGAMLGLVFEAAAFKQHLKPSVSVKMLFTAALAVCIVSWASLISASGPSSAPYGFGPDEIDIGLETYASEEGGFEIPVPKGMTTAEKKLKLATLDVGQGEWVFYRVTWRGAGPYDEPDSLAKTAISDRSLEGNRDRDISEAHLKDRKHIEVGGEDAVFFVLSMLVRGSETFYAQAILIHEEKVYTITFYYPAEDELRGRQVDAILDGFRFAGPARQR